MDEHWGKLSLIESSHSTAAELNLRADEATPNHPELSKPQSEKSKVGLLFPSFVLRMRNAFRLRPFSTSKQAN
jgi:hypothetical protein